MNICDIFEVFFNIFGQICVGVLHLERSEDRTLLRI